MSVPMRNPLFVALDVDSADQAIQLARKLSGLVGGFKVGPRLVVPHGASLISRLAEYGPLFVDMKFLDIPNTMDAAVRSTFAAGATWATIHAWSGGPAMARLAAVEDELNQQRPFQILAVTILTSFSQETLPPPLRGMPIADQVVALAQLVQQSGLKGIVSSAWELPALQKTVAGFFKVVPGIRLPNAPADDQARTLTPQEAIKGGASALVIGRPIIQAPDPVQITESILSSLNGD